MTDVARTQIQSTSGVGYTITLVEDGGSYEVTTMNNGTGEIVETYTVGEEEDPLQAYNIVVGNAVNLVEKEKAESIPSEGQGIPQPSEAEYPSVGLPMDPPIEVLGSDFSEENPPPEELQLELNTVGTDEPVAEPPVEEETPEEPTEEEEETEEPPVEEEPEEQPQQEQQTVETPPANPSLTEVPREEGIG